MNFITNLINYLKKFIEDENGNPSSTRIGKFLILFLFAWEYISFILRHIQYNPDTQMVMIIVGILGISTWQSIKGK